MVVEYLKIFWNIAKGFQSYLFFYDFFFHIQNHKLNLKEKDDFYVREARGFFVCLFVCLLLLFFHFKLTFLNCYHLIYTDLNIVSAGDRIWWNWEIDKVQDVFSILQVKTKNKKQQNKTKQKTDCANLVWNKSTPELHFLKTSLW